MKYHYQYVSETTVRIELIPEDQKETLMIEKLIHLTEANEQLLALFQKGLQGYSIGTTLITTKFMNFPKVALCSYTKVIAVQHLPVY